ncbi:hypothetical protein C8Q76DRAFT_857300 [Earliella scabrosa]|nr:hypothetical protein C8Q76DRAFT_857300 [Earliella scabrosa]
MSGRAKRTDAGPSARYVSRQQQQAANTAKPRGKNVGKLSFLLNAPKDVFFEECGVGRAINVDYAARIRLCGACWTQRVETGGKLAYASGLYYDPDLTKIVMNLLPAAPHEKPRMAWDRPVTTMAPHSGAGNTPAAVSQGEHSPFHRAQFLSLVDEYRKLCAGESTGSLKQFIVLNRTRTITRLKFQAELALWEYQGQQTRIADADQAKTSRRAAIEAKLRELGYEPEDYPSRHSGIAASTDFHKILDQPRNLTPRIWNNVKPKLLEILRTERAHRDEKAFVAKWYMRREALRGLYNVFVHARRDEELWARTMPGFEEMIRKPAMAGLLTSARPSEPITEEQFATIQPDIAREAREALQTAIAVLAQVVRDAEAQEGANATQPAPQMQQPKSKKSKKSVSDGKQRKSKAKDKGKARATSADLEDDTPAPTTAGGRNEDQAADIALLERPSSIFHCKAGSCGNNRDFDRRALPIFDLLEHYTKCHARSYWGAPPIRGWGALSVDIAKRDERDKVVHLLDALDLPHDARHSAVRERIMSGTPQCTCGFNPPPPSQYHRMFQTLMNHVTMRRMPAIPGMPPAMIAHHITFIPQGMMPTLPNAVNVPHLGLQIPYPNVDPQTAQMQSALLQSIVQQVHPPNAAVAASAQGPLAPAPGSGILPNANASASASSSSN